MKYFRNFKCDNPTDSSKGLEGLNKLKIFREFQKGNIKNQVQVCISLAPFKY